MAQVCTISPEKDKLSVTVLQSIPRCDVNATPFILIIEDDATMLRGLKDNFESQGFAVRTACDGKAGLEAALGGPCDLVVLDIMLPKLNGYEVCRLLRGARLGDADHHADGQGARGGYRSRP